MKAEVILQTVTCKIKTFRYYTQLEIEILFFLIFCYWAYDQYNTNVYFPQMLRCYIMIVIYNKSKSYLAVYDMADKN